MNTDYFVALCDDTGMFQHAVGSIPDRAHGYCLDDNARALLVATGLERSGSSPLLPQLAVSFCAFIQHAWNPDRRRFRNFMSFDRRWLEEAGSEDSHGRALWSLGVCARDSVDAGRKVWAATLFAAASPVVLEFRSPRAFGFTLLGLDGYCEAVPADRAAADLRAELAKRLTGLLAAVETADRVWFENGLAYDNARLPQALLLTGQATGSDSLKAAGLRSLAWLMTQQVNPAGQFRPVGSQGFSDVLLPPKPFDQQPVEAAATIAAALAAEVCDRNNGWPDVARKAFAWFEGANDLGIALVDRRDGSCRDGLHPDRANENRGAESVVSWLLAALDMRQFVALAVPKASFLRLRA